MRGRRERKKREDNKDIKSLYKGRPPRLFNVQDKWHLAFLTTLISMALTYFQRAFMGKEKGMYKYFDK